MIRALIQAAALLLGFGLPAFAQDAPRVAVDIDPAGPVTAGSPVIVAITVLVPTYMPAPPVWPDLQIADAITRLPDRATHPVTRRVDGASWSGLTRSYEIVPQRAADYDLSGARLTVTLAGADNSPQHVSLAVPDIAFSATVPPGAEGLDPFVAATDLTVAVKAEGLPDAPRPGDALTLTLTTTASGPPAMLLPPILDQVRTPAGMRAYPKQPSLADSPGENGGSPTATRVETVTYVIEAPGRYTVPGVSLAWWNLASHSVETATTDPVAFDVAPPAGWTARAASDRAPWAWIAGSIAVLASAVAALAIWHRRRASKPAGPPSEHRMYRDLRRTVRTAPPGQVRAATLAWLERATPDDRELGADLEAALLALERSAYDGAGSPSSIVPPTAERGAVLAALAARRRSLGSRRSGAGRTRLPALNPARPAATSH